jgi:tetratricopeptide (TPR) repeat protein
MDTSAISLVYSAERAIGTAFFVSPRLLLTCLHVVRAEHNLNVRLVDSTGSIIKERHAVALIQKIPHLDIAVLSLIDIPATTEFEYLPLTPFPIVRGHRFVTCGFPGATGGGLTEVLGWLRVRREVQPPKNLNFLERSLPAFQLDPDNQFMIPQGLSGAPVFAPYLGAVVGVFAGFFPGAVTSDGAMVGNAGQYAIPISDVLRNLSPELKQSITPQILPHLAKTGIADTYSPRTFCPTIPEAIWNDALSSTKPSIVSLMGPSGIGKSSHASMWATAARADGHIVVWSNVARDRGLGTRENTSCKDMLFSALRENESASPDLSQEEILEQISSALDEHRSITGHDRRKMVFVADGLETFKELKAVKERLAGDLLALADSGIPAMAVLTERSEFCDARPLEAPDANVHVHPVIMAPLSVEEAVRVYEEGYRRTDYAWLPPADALPAELLDLCRVPLFITFIIRAAADMELGRQSNVADLLQGVIKAGVKTAISQLPAVEGGAFVEDALLGAMEDCLRLVCRKTGLATPPVHTVKRNEIVSDIQEALRRNGLDTGSLNPYVMLSGLSKAGLVDYHDHSVRVASDVIYEFLLCEEYVGLVADPDGCSNDKDTIQKEVTKLISALWGRSDEIVTSQAMNDLVERLLFLPPSQESIALRFWSILITKRPDWPIHEYGLQLRLFQTISHYTSQESDADASLDDRIYRMAQQAMPTLVAEVLLAYPPTADFDGKRYIAFEIENSTEKYEFENVDGWICMRRAIYLLYVISQHTVTVLQNIAEVIDHSKVSEPFSARMISLATAIVQQFPQRALEAYVCNRKPIIGLLIWIGASLEREGSSNSEWPNWFQKKQRRILITELSGACIENDRVDSASVFLVAAALRMMRAAALECIAEVLRSESRGHRVACLHITKIVVGTRLQVLPYDVKQKMKEMEIEPKVFDNWGPPLRKELEIHQKRPDIDEEERSLAEQICGKLWDGVQQIDALPEAPKERPVSIETTVNVEMEDHPLIDIVRGMSEQFRKKEDAFQRALDALVLCLTIVGERPEEWQVAWDEVSDLILAVDAIHELTSIRAAATREKEARPGERYDALNLMLVPFNDESRFGREYKEKAIHVERWAKRHGRFPGEMELISQFHQAEDLFHKKDYTRAVTCARQVIASKPGPIITANCLQIVAGATHKNGDSEAALQVIEELEQHVKATYEEPLDILVDFDELGPMGEELLTIQRRHLTAMMWPARDLRARILQSRGDGESLAQALANVIANRLEAQEFGAWGDAFRALGRECDLAQELGRSDAALKAAKQYEEAFPNPPQCLLGRMQYAVSLYYEGVRVEDDARVQESLTSIEELEPRLPELAAVLPGQEMEGIELWLGSIKGWSLQRLGRFEEAIDASKKIVELARRIDAEDEESKALGQLSRCQEETGRLHEAFESAKARYRLCEGKDSGFAEEAAAAAHMAARLLAKMFERNQADETRELANHWQRVAVDRYTKLGRDDMVTKVKTESDIS